MGTYLGRVTLSNTSALPENNAVNTFAFQLGGLPGATDAELITAANHILDFYRAGTVTSESIYPWLSPAVSRNANWLGCSVYEVQDLSGASLADGGIPMGSPRVSVTGTVPAGGGTQGLPNEVAVCMTLRAFDYNLQPVERADGSDPGTAVDRPRQRYTGRIYLGPLSSAILSHSGGDARVITTAMDAIIFRANALADALAAMTGRWSVWSRADSAFRAITEVSVNNAFDTMRSRGLVSSAGAVLSVSGGAWAA